MSRTWAWSGTRRSRGGRKSLYEPACFFTQLTHTHTLPPSVPLSFGRFAIPPPWTITTSQRGQIPNCPEWWHDIKLDQLSTTFQSHLCNRERSMCDFSPQICAKCASARWPVGTITRAVIRSSIDAVFTVRTPTPAIPLC